MVVILSICALQSTAQIISSGPCPNLPVEQNFDLVGYLGRWYDYKCYLAYFQQDGKCVSATYSENSNGTVGVRNYLVKAATGEVETINGYAVVNSDTGEGKLGVYFPSVGSENSPYWVLGTDYQTYSVIWGCTEVGNNNFQFSWVLTRERYPDALTIATAQGIIDANGLQDAYVITKHESCPLDP